MQITFNDPEGYKDTAIIAYVYPFDNVDSMAIVVRVMSIDLHGSAYLTPKASRHFAQALIEAADIAELGYEKATDQARGKQDHYDMRSLQAKDLRSKLVPKSDRYER